MMAPSLGACLGTKNDQRKHWRQWVWWLLPPQPAHCQCWSRLVTHSGSNQVDLYLMGTNRVAVGLYSPAGLSLDSGEALHLV